MYKLPEGKVLALRTCDNEMKSTNNFVWPESGPVECPDWIDSQSCGNGLHGLLWGEGDGSLLDWSEDAKWLVVEVDADLYINLGGKIKFPHATVVHCGTKSSSIEFITEFAPDGKAIIASHTTAGDHGAATAGDHGTATAGDHGAATAGDHGTATAGNGGTATAGDLGTATAGDDGTATAGNHGAATAGVRGTATAGVRGTATAGVHGTATAGVHGTATAGNGGTAAADHHGTAAAGHGGIVIINFHDGQRYRVRTAYVGENGIMPDKKYKLLDGEFVVA